MKVAIFGMLVAVALLGCATPEVQTPEQRNQQALALRENGELLRRVKIGSSKPEVQQVMGPSSNRQNYLER